MSNPTRDRAQSKEEGEEQEGVLLCLRIKSRLEDLFSDSHLAQDGFLLKHVQRNRDGYVSLKLLTCLKQIKVLTTDWYMTLVAAEYSDLLEVNEECTKVRRKEQLPKWLLCSPTSKLLLAWNISEEKTGANGAARGVEHPSLSERIFQKFSAHSSVSALWILEPDKELPKELQKYAKRHKELGQHLCAVVKFQHLEDVRRAYRALKEEEERSNGEHMRVTPLGYQSMNHLVKEENIQDQAGEENALENLQDLAVKVSAETEDSPRLKESQNNPPQTTSCSSCKGRSFLDLHPRCGVMNFNYGDGDREECLAPWVRKRKFAALARNQKECGDLNKPRLRLKVLRQPYGPDATKGFSVPRNCFAE